MVRNLQIPEQLEEDAPITSRTRSRLRSHASSETSIAPDHSRKPSRRSSSSASSSVGPIDLVLNRRTEPRVQIRNGSDDTIDVYDALCAEHGFEMQTWSKTRELLVSEFAPLCQLAEDIPHELEDMINTLPLFARRANNMQVTLFEAAIANNTADDEPHAPPIHIINDVDDELTPPYEFHYSNLMWHGQDVPKPNIEDLKGCDCFGPCDPNSKTCSCLKRQREYWGETGFIYDYRGRLREHDYPIFECNAFCGCEGDCRNRVVQNGRKHAVDIRKTRDKGWGVFAGSKKIPANTFIGIYAGEYLTDEQGEERGTLYNKFGRTYLFDLDFHHLKSDQPDWSPQYCVDAYHAGNNHSCDPNCNINPCYINEANMDKPLLTIFTSRDVDAGQELCFSYFGPMDDDDSQEDGAHVHDAVYVPCRCGAKRCRGRMWK
ncbi:SET domain-containing protein [Amylocystis lapponica]|nr:SET domain-containing protein [Amylocystis lapponica]